MPICQPWGARRAPRTTNGASTDLAFRPFSANGDDQDDFEQNLFKN